MADWSRLANYLEDWRHRLLRYPVDRIEARRARIFHPVETASPIPRVIVQTYRTAEVPRPIHAAVTRWQETNPEFEYRFFDDAAARTFIETHFPDEVLRAFDALVPGAFRADLWRYCYLVKHGGVYVDIRMEPLMALRTILDLSAPKPPAFVSARDIVRPGAGAGFVHNAFVAAAPNHPFLVCALERALKSIANRDYGRNELDITGPGCLGAAVNLALGRPFNGPFEPGDHDDRKAGPFRLLLHEADPYHRKVHSHHGTPFIVTKCLWGQMWRADPEYRQDSYSKYYRKRAVFRRD